MHSTEPPNIMAVFASFYLLVGEDYVLPVVGHQMPMAAYLPTFILAERMEEYVEWDIHIDPLRVNYAHADGLTPRFRVILENPTVFQPPTVPLWT